MKFIILALSAFSLVGFGQDIIFPLSYVKFAGETTQLTEDGLPSLDSLATFLALTGAKVEICGHTDNVGTPAEKQHLSEARAKAVCDYLRSKHVVPESNLTYKGYGPSMPVATNRTPEGRAKNNRIEIKILSPVSMAGLEFIKGKILIHKPNISEPDTLSGSRDVTLYDRIITDTLGRVNLHFNRTLVKILPNSDIVIKNLNKDQKIIELHLKEGKVIVSAKEDSLSLTTPSCSLSTNHGEFVFKTERYYRDWISVWSGSVRMSASGSTYLVNEGNGTICYYGKKILPPRNLPESPVLDTTRQEDSLIYDGTTPMKFFCIKPAQVGVRFLLSKDPLFSDIIFETITPSESCVVSPVEIPRVYLSLSSVDESGLESRALKTYSFEISSPKMKYVPPELHITKQVIEKVGVDRYLHLEGKTEPETDLLINTVKIKTKEDGSFAIRARILPKTRAVIITAINRKGQKTEIRIPVAERRKMTLEIAGG
ncbi:MAG: OmpA family protein, partial [candidate division WOR-3 bacterium]